MNLQNIFLAFLSLVLINQQFIRTIWKNTPTILLIIMIFILLLFETDEMVHFVSLLVITILIKVIS